MANKEAKRASKTNTYNLSNASVFNFGSFGNTMLENILFRAVNQG